MANVSVYNIEGKEVGTIDLSDAVFGVEVNEHLLHMAVVNQLANNRQGTQKAKTRSEVSGGGRKPWRQKGTGRARVGTSRSPLWRGGAIIFGPKPREYSYSIPKKKRRLALKSVLSSKVAENEIIVLDTLNFDQPKTKEMVKVLNALHVDAKALVVTADVDENVIKSARNIEGITPVAAASINVYDVLAHNKLIITKDAIAKVEEVLA